MRVSAAASSISRCSSSNICASTSTPWLCSSASVQRDGDVVHADRLDRAAHDHLLLVDRVALLGQAGNDVTDADRAVKLAGIRRSADQHHFGASDLFALLLGHNALLGVFGFETFAIGFEHLLVRFIGAQRLLLREQEVAGVAVLDGYDVADRAQLLDTFEEDDIHVSSPLTSRCRAASRCGERA